MSRKLLFGLLGVGVLVAVLIAGLIVMVAMLDAQRDPRDEVRAYLEAIAAGDAETASSLLDPGVQPGQLSLLTNDVFARAKAKIEIDSIAEAHYRSDGSASVKATYTLEGEEFQHYFQLRPGPKEFLFLNTWELSGDPLLEKVTLTIPYALGVATVGDRELRSSDGLSALLLPTYSNSYWLYPGSYEVAYEAPNGYYSSDDTTLRVSSAAMDFEAEAEETQALHDEVLRLVIEHAQACVDDPELDGEFCPTAYWRRELASMAMDAVPTAFTEIGFGRFRIKDFEFTMQEKPSEANPTPQLEVREFEFLGDYSVIDGDVVLDIYAAWPLS